MYEEHFGLKETPFSIAPNPRFLYMSERHREALAHLVYGVNSNGGFVLLTGEVGTGKTTISRCLLEQIPANTNVAVILNPKVVAHELLATICDELHIEYEDGLNSIKSYVDRIYRYLLEANSAGRKTVVIIEESQNLTIDVLEQLRMLTNLETDQHKLMQIIMIGQPELLELLALPELRQLEQRVTARYHLLPLSYYDTSEYIKHRLKVAGMRDPLFRTAIIKRIHKLSGGVPRRINLLCDRVMLGAYVQNSQKVDTSLLNKAAVEVFGFQYAKRSLLKSRWLQWGVAAIVLVVSGAGISAAYYKNSNKAEKSRVLAQAAEPTLTQTQSALKPATNNLPSVITGTLPDQPNPAKESEKYAYKALFDMWNINFDASMGEDYCEIARANGLACLAKRGNITSLQQFNRPAVLKLVSRGSPFYITAELVNNNSVFAHINGKKEEISLDELRELWFGEFTLLWRAPPSFSGPIAPGTRGSDVLWLSNQISTIVGRVLSKDENLYYDDELVEDVKTFQAAQGLTSDGIAGPHTLIHLNTEMFDDVPLLNSSDYDASNS